MAVDFCEFQASPVYRLSTRLPAQHRENPQNQNKREGKQDGSVLLLYKADNLSSLEPTFKWKERSNCAKLSSDVFRCSMARDLSCHAPPPLRRKLQHRGSLPSASEPSLAP